MSFKVADLFCGAGGFSTGALAALGARDVELVAVNHWQVAVDTHKRNHPGADVRRVDVYTESPRAAVPSGELDLLMASPTCTYFSRARGGRPVSWDQRKGRMTPTQVYRWAKELRVKRLLVENVPEFLDWGPICKRRTSCKKHGWTGPKNPGDICGKPRAERKGLNFRRWVARLRNIGFTRIEWRIVNAADYGDATTRERFFLMATSDGSEIHWPAPSHSKDGTPDLFGAGAKKWRAAREIIRWKRRGRSIFTRKKPLAAKTLLRIHAGLIKFGWPARFVFKLRRYMLSLGIALPELEWTGNASRPFVFQMNQSRDRIRGLRSVEAPLGTVLASGTDLGLIEPGVLVLRKNADMRSCGAPLPAVLAGGTHLGLIEPLVMRSDCQGGNGHNTRTSKDPIYTPTTNGGLAVVEPFLLPQHFGRPARSVDLPAPPPVAVDRTALVEPFVLSQGAGGAPRAVSAPVPTIPTDGAHAFIAPYYGASDPSPVAKPLGTVTTRDRFGIVMPVTHTDGSSRARSTDSPVPAVTCAPRGELAFITAAFGERPGQAARVRSVEEPVPTVLAQGRIPVVQGEDGAAVATLDDELADVDILFRMLDPDELAAAMGFPRSYRFKGNKTERTRQIGNAVAVNTARALVAALMGLAA